VKPVSVPALQALVGAIRSGLQPGQSS